MMTKTNSDHEPRQSAKSRPANGRDGFDGNAEGTRRWSADGRDAEVGRMPKRSKDRSEDLAALGDDDYDWIKYLGEGRSSP